MIFCDPFKRIVTTIAFVSLTACGGGSGGDKNSNASPSFSSNGSVSVTENTNRVVYTPTADDPDGDELTYSLAGGADQLQFQIQTTSGSLNFITAPDFENPSDSDSDNRYIVVIEVKDNNGGVSSQTVTIDVTDIESILATQFDYPTPSANLGGLVTNTTVTGRIINTDGKVDTNDIVSVEVNGELAVFSQRNPTHWSVEIPVAMGRNTLSVSANFTDGTTYNDEQLLHNDLLLIHPQSATLDTANNRVLIVDSALDAVIAVDLGDGSRRLLSNNVNKDLGFSFFTPMATVFDEVRNQLLVMDAGFNTLVTVNLNTGQRSVVSNSNVGSGPEFSTFPTVSLEIDSLNNTAFIVNSSPYSLLSIDLANGNRTLLSNNSLGNGPNIGNVKSIKLDSTNNRFLLVDIDSNSLISVDISSGDRELVADNSIGNGPRFSELTAVSIEPSNNKAFLLDTGLDTLLSVDLASGNRTLISGSNRGKGLIFRDPVSILIGNEEDQVIVLDRGLDALVTVNISTGDRIPLSDDHSGIGESFDFPRAVSFDAIDNKAYVVKSELTGSPALYSVDLTNGNRIVVSENEVFSDGLNPFRPGDIVIAPEGLQAFILDSGRDSIVAIDLINGDGKVVSNIEVGDGEKFRYPVSMKLNKIENQLLVVDQSLGQLFSVNLNTGNRTIVSGQNRGIGPSFDTPISIAFDENNRQAFILDLGLQSLLSVNLETGDRSIISFFGDQDEIDNVTLTDMVFDSSENRVIILNRGNGRSGILFFVDILTGDVGVISGRDKALGPELLFPTSVTIDVKNNILFVVDSNLDALIVVDIESGDRAIASK